MAHSKALQKTLFNEFRERIRQTDISVPYRKNGYFYYSRMEDGKEYPIYCRKRGSLDASEQVMADVNQIAAGHDFCSVRRPAVSPDARLMAYPVDTVGRRFYDIRFRDLRTGEDLPDLIPGVTPNVVWANDNKTVFYTKQDAETLRYHRVYRHVLGTDSSTDALVFEETDATFECEVSRSRSEKYLLISSSQTLSDEHRYLDAANPTGEFRVFAPRRRNHEHDIDHFGDSFYVRTNRDAVNFRLMKTPANRTGEENWRDVVPPRDDVYLDDFVIFKDHLVVEERKAGLLHLRVMPWPGGGDHYVDFGEPAYTASAFANFEYDTPVLRYRYSSMTTPDSVYDYNMETREKKLLKREEILGGFDSSNYETERLHVPARDGVNVPVSIVYRKDRFSKDGTNPLLQLGYGFYGFSEDAAFSAYLISLLDRGFVYSLAHIRGGQEMGRQWYENGKLLNKKNTFTDFIDCAEYLVREGYAAPDKVFAQGGSAGGLLMGAVINMRPELWRGVFAAVPFVDVITTMLEEDIPLTTSEYYEWGNPNDKKYYDYMLSYSPYDQVEAKDYPNMLVQAGLHDSQVQYWEPAKWVAKLRAMKTDDNLLLLHTEMEAGHGGVSGRYKSYRERALIYAFFLDLAGIRQ